MRIILGRIVCELGYSNVHKEKDGMLLVISKIIKVLILEMQMVDHLV